MRNRKLLIFITLILFVVQLPAIFVEDWLTRIKYAEKIANIIGEAGKWVQYIKLWKQYWESYHWLNWDVGWKLKELKEWEYKALRPHDLSKFLGNWYFNDPLKKDTWHDILDKLIRLEEKYKNLLNTDYLKETPLYQENINARQLYSDSRKKQEEYLESVEQFNELLMDYKSWEEQNTDNYKVFAAKIEGFGKRNTGLPEKNREVKLKIRYTRVCQMFWENKILDAYLELKLKEIVLNSVLRQEQKGEANGKH